MDTLYITIPAYNEEANIETVAREWHAIVEAVGGESRLVVIDDGSKDGTYAALQRMQADLPRLQALTKPNGGHGATVQYGYQYALSQGADYVFQTDSDGQTIAQEFWPFWEQRANYDLQVGHRTKRQDGLSRVLVTKVLKLVLFLSFRLWIPDANTPFRLMNAASLQKHLREIPDNYSLTNVILSVAYTRAGDRIRYLPISFRQRQGGVNSINLRRITKIGMQAFRDFRSIQKAWKAQDA